MSLQKSFYVDETEVRCAQVLLESMNDRDDIVFQTLLKKFRKTVLVTTVISNFEDEGKKKVCVALAAARSPILRNMFEYDGTLNLPKEVIRELHLRKRKSNDNIKLMIYSDFYQIDYQSIFNEPGGRKPMPKITMTSLFNYIIDMRCKNIDTAIMQPVKSLIIKWLLTYDVLCKMMRCLEPKSDKTMTPKHKKIYHIAKQYVPEYGTQEVNLSYYTLSTRKLCDFCGSNTSNYFDYNSLYNDFISDNAKLS